LLFRRLFRPSQPEPTQPLSPKSKPLRKSQLTTYVLDTNVLLQDPMAFTKFEEHNVIIPMVVVEELDTFKKDLSEKGYAAREVARQLDALRAQAPLRNGVTLSTGGLLTVSFDTLESASNDNRIIDTALRSSALGHRTVLVSRDVNVRLKADAAGLEAEDFQNAHIKVSDDTYTGVRTQEVTPDVIDELYQNGYLPLGEEWPEMHENEFLHLTSGKQSGICVYSNHYLQKVIPPENVWGLEPRNLEQTLALNLLLDPSVQLVTVSGVAGTGKTLLALAAGLSVFGFGDEPNLYDKVVVSRPVIPMGKDLGYLPGTLEDKMDPWMKPIYDNLEFLVSNSSRKKVRRKSKGSKSRAPQPASNYQYLLDTGMVEVEALTYIRGRSIPYQYMIIDEAQNLTSHEVKTILTRAGDGTKVVLTGDPAQIDNPYVDSLSNGLTYAIEKFKDQPIAGHVTLTKGERSHLATIAATIL